MKIRLINFRCYSDKIFDFGEDGLVLISAVSGAGISTILMAIQFALYGTGSKLVKYGEKSCKVELEYRDMKIIRLSGKNKITVSILNDIYDGDTAQKILNERFGETFDVTGYIAQKEDSFISKSQPEKLAFLERFAFKNVNLEDIKSKSASLLSQRKTDLIKATSQLELGNEMFKKYNVPDKIDYPYKNVDNYDALFKNEFIKIQNCDKKVKTLRRDIDKLYKEIGDIKVLNTNLNNKTSTLDSIDKKIDDISIKRNGIIYTGDTQLEKYKDILKNMILHRELISLQETLLVDTNKLEIMKKTELAKYKTDLQKIKDSLWMEYTKDEIKEMLKDKREEIKYAKKLSFLNTEISECKVDETDLELLKQSLISIRHEFETNRILLENVKNNKKVLICPSCNIQLQLRDDKKLYKYDEPSVCHVNDIEKLWDIDGRLKEKIKLFEADIPEKENNLKRFKRLQLEIDKIKSEYEELDENSLIEDMEYLDDYNKSELEKEKRLLKIENNINNNIFSDSYRVFEKDVSNLKIKINKLLELNPSVENENFTEDKLRKIINEEEKMQDIMSRLDMDEKVLISERSKILQDISLLKDNHLKLYTDQDEKTIDSLIKTNKTMIDELEQKKEKALLKIEECKRYSEYIVKKAEEARIKDLEKTEKIARNRHSAALIAKENILEAEMIVLSNIVESINTHAQIYLDLFFIENPIVVKLSAFKEKKTGEVKPQINLEIDYNGMELSDPKYLSGGEYSRVVLAFTLALGEMFNTPLMLLDESTASLDQEATTLVFDAIKENFKDKIVVIIAHQVVQGVFDRIITLV